MGVSLGVVEYAFVEGMNIEINKQYSIVNQDTGEIETRYKHSISLLYTCQGADRKEIVKKRCNHFVDSLTPIQSKTQFLTALSNNLPTWISEDKLELSGYDGV